MTKKVLLLSLLLVLKGLGLAAQDISNTMLDGFEKETIQSATDKALVNAITNNNLKKLAINRNNIETNDHSFKYKVDVKGITDQKHSGRCWMFTSLNTLRPKVMDLYGLKKFEFSENYLYFYDILEKSNLFLEKVILTRNLKMNEDVRPVLAKGAKDANSVSVNWLFKSPVSDGGAWNNFVNLVQKYGLVPKTAMPETYNSENTSMLKMLVNRKLREDGLELRKIKGEEDARAQKEIMLKDIYRILVLTLGQPPKEFTWRYTDKDGNMGELKEYTPLKFAKEVIDVDFDNYVMLMNVPSHPYYKLYEVSFNRNMVEGKNWKYINLPAEELKRIALESIKENEALYASCDVKKQFNKSEGFSAMDNYQYGQLLGVEFTMDKKDRIISGDTHSTHGMAIVAVDVDADERPTMWQFENSWGKDSGHDGYITFTDQWFSEYIFRLVAHKQFVGEDIIKILDSKAIVLPPWDPMLSEDL